MLLLAVIGGIVVECVATPLYRRSYQQNLVQQRGAWFDIAEAAFGFTLLIEFVIKVIADGFVFTPNAYVRSIWNILDFLILVGILVNIFGGIMKCDIIAEGVVAAAKEVNLSVPLVVRLEGTNVQQGKDILANSGLPIVPADDLGDAAKKIVAQVKQAA